MKINLVVGEVLKRTRVNKLVYSNLLTRKAMTLSIDSHLPSVQDARKYLSNVKCKPEGTSCGNNKINEIKYDLKIIIPAFNVESYIDECLSSIISQKTEFSFSVLIINDGSSDNTRNILKKYEDFPFVTIIDQSNKGFSGARNTGLQVIDSKYLMFVDSDDKLHNNAIQSLLTSAFINDSDVVEGGYYKFHNDKILFKNTHNNNNDVKALGNLIGFPWGKVIRSSYFENIKFPEGFLYEDTIISYLVYSQCKKSSTVSDMVYWYRLNPNGISEKSKHDVKCIDTYWILEQMLNDMIKLKITPTQDIYEETLRQVQLNFKRTRRMDDITQKSIFALTANIIQTQFAQFQSKLGIFKDLEKSLRTNNYKQYFQFCTLL